MQRFTKVLSYLGLVGLVVTLWGCEENVDPVLGVSQPFTMYGFIDPTATRQTLRVFPIDGRLLLANNPRIDAQVESTDLGTNETVVWTEDFRQYEDGQYGFVFRGPFSASFEGAYRLRVSRSDGLASEVVVNVPPRVEMELLEPIDTPGLIAQPVLWGSETPQLIDVKVVYNLQVGLSADSELTAVTIRYTGRVRQVEEGWRVDVTLAEDLDIIRGELFRRNLVNNFTTPLILNQVTISGMIVNKEWNPPGGRFNPDALVEPGTFSNVENGFGFFGAGYVEQVAWVPEAELMRRAGFTPPPPPEGTRVDSQ